jgi:hypothetical protein
MQPLRITNENGDLLSLKKVWDKVMTKELSFNDGDVIEITEGIFKIEGYEYEGRGYPTLKLSDDGVTWVEYKGW